VIVALQGARARREGEYRNHVIGAWMTGLLAGMADPKTYPELNTLLEPEDKPEPAPADPAEASSNARAWGAWLQAVNKRAGV